MALLSEHKIATTPQNYEIFFAHVSAQNQNLSDSLNEILSNGSEFTQAISDQLYATHFNESQTKADSVFEIGGQMQVEIDGMVETIQSAMKETSAYGDTLHAVSGQLGSAKGPAAIQSMIDNLVSATRQMEERNKKLENQLEASTSEISGLRNNLEEIQQEALTDQLTGLANRKAFDKTIEKAVERATSENEDLCVLFSDIDHFKKFNDTWGHQTGDKVLRLVAKCFEQSVKGRDTAARYGGEEFVVVLPETSLDNAITLADQIRQTVESKHLQKKSTGEDLGTITISIGAAQFRHGESIDALVHRADGCLYAAKQAGRNRVVSENDKELEAVADLAKGAA